MCSTAAASLVNWVFGTIGCVLLGVYGGVAEACFFFTVVAMQLVEFLIHLDPACGLLNATASVAGVVINHCEVIALWAGIRADPAAIHPPQWVHTMMRIYIALAILYSSFVLGWQCTRVSERSAPYLDWLWNDGVGHVPFYIFFLVVMNVLSWTCLRDGAFMCLLATGSYLWSYALYNKYHAVGSVWCGLASLGPWLVLCYRAAVHRPLQRKHRVASVLLTLEDMTLSLARRLSLTQ